MKEKLTPKIFMEILKNAVTTGKITQDQKDKIEIECAYIQYQNPSELNKSMEKFLYDLGIKND